MSTSTVKRRVLGVDWYLWTTPIEGDIRGRRERHEAVRGEVIEISPEEAARGEAIIEKGVPALGPEDATPPAANGEFAAASEDDIEAMGVAEVTAYLSAVPEDQQDNELDRVLALENARPRGPRAGVLALGEDLDPDDDTTA